MRRRQLPLVLALLAGSVSAGLRAADNPELARYDATIKPSARKHWAFLPVRRVAVPLIKDRQRASNPIDAFVRAALEQRGWTPAPPAEPRALLRRLYLDVIGLPPTPQEQLSWEADPSEEAYQRVVDSLLASPHYGERWARHWLDLVRYADTNGYERDADKPQVWRYRDYVVGALNADKPYDRFVLEQLAGDELPDATPETVIATGFCRLGPWDDEPADPRVDHFDQLDDMVATTSQAFLGLTLGCARCHNHKFEPLTMHDYYRMVAVFHPLQRPRNGRTELDTPALPPGRRQQRVAALHQLARLRAAQVGSRLASQTPLGNLTTAATLEQLAHHCQEALPQAPRAYFLEESSPRAPPTHLLLRGQPSRPGPEVAPGVPAVLVVRQPDFLPPAAHTSRRRLSLARWIASSDNPLTARVLVNRVWQHHFGEGLVRSPSDFGAQGSPPTHPKLLDWLASWFMREGWSLKKLHRLILTSNTYRMSKRWHAEYGSLDPEVRLLWRVPYQRLDAEAIRDCMLAVSGQLNSRLYGPTMHPEVPRAALEGHSDPDSVWRASGEREASRRTLYAHVKRSLLVPMVEVLDFCDTTRSTARRTITTVAPQALTLYNGAFVNRQAVHLAARLRSEAGLDPRRQIGHAFRLALCRPPSPAEEQALLDFLRQRAADGQTLEAAREQMCRVLLNSNEFVYPD
jgi:hypothetical protein